MIDDSLKTMLYYVLLALVVSLINGLCASPLFADTAICFESRKGASEIKPQGVPLTTNGHLAVMDISCSPKTGAVLWWADPFVYTVPMAVNSAEGEGQTGEAWVRPRVNFLKSYRPCGSVCHNGRFPRLISDKNPRALAMHLDVVPDALNLQHGNQAIWCLDCHHPTQRNTLIDNFGNPISFNEPQKLCGKCHGSSYRDWREGIHGKRIGEWASNGKKRWFVCSECHNPHDVQQGDRKSSFSQIMPESAPLLPKGVLNRDHELKNADGSWKSVDIKAKH